MQFDRIEEICKSLGIDSLAYLSVEGLLRAVGGAGGGDAKDFCNACFTGDYPVAHEANFNKRAMEVARDERIS